MADVKVTATMDQTGVETTAVTSKSGEYTLPFLQPGTYTIRVDAEGFQRYEQKNLTLSAGDHPIIDIALHVGAADQTIEVTADAPLLETADDSLGQVVTTKQVESLPLNGRTPIMLAQLTVGVIATANPAAVHPYDNSGQAAFSVGGLANKSSEALVDGSPDNAQDNSPAYSPPVDAVDEVRVHIFESDATYGHASGGVVNMISKSGTNRLHGTLSEFNQVSYLASNNYFADRTGAKKGVSRYNQYGGTIGGPVFIPKLFNGHDRLFFFFGYEGIKDSQPANTFLSVPTAAERMGDFSALLADPVPVQLYDPYSGVAGTVGGKAATVRQPYVNNIIPASELAMSPVAQAILKFYPTPTLNPNGDGHNDYFSQADNGDKFSNEFARVDYSASDRDKLFVTFRHNNRLQFVNQLLGTSNPALGDFLSRINYGGTIGNVYTANASTIIETRVNYSRYVQNQTSAGEGFQSTSLGFPSYLQSNATALLFPQINLTTFQSLGVPTTGYGFTPFNSYGLFGSVTKVMGKQTIKAGADARLYQKGNLTTGASQGSFTFNNAYVSQNSTLSTTPSTGQDLASLVLGLPTSGSYDINGLAFTSNPYLAIFVQDDWRVRPDLTLNLGLRYDRDFDAYERDARATTGFDTTAVNPVSAAAAAAYNMNPIPQIPAGSFTALGGLTFASPSDKNLYNSQSHMVSPRFGFSYTPGQLGGKTVIRGGFGLFVAPIIPTTNQQGFSQTTQLQASNSFLPPTAATGTLSNPFPQSILQPAGASAGFGTFLGQTIGVYGPNVRNAYAERWNLGIQHQLPGSLLVEAMYIGNHALRLPVTQNVNAIPTKYLTTASNTALNATVANPFKGLLPNGGSLNNATIPLAQLLVPFPEFPINGVGFVNAPVGSSYYNALDIRVEKRAGRGITLIANYQWSKTMERVTYLNPQDAAPELRISQFDHPTHAVVGITYELPFGHGRQFGGQSGRLVDLAFGGWTINGIYSLQTGAPLTFGDITPIPGVSLNYNRRQATQGASVTTTVPSFNTAAFSSIIPTNHIRTFPSQFSNLRADGINNLDASIFKGVRITDSSQFQLRLEAFNATNRPQFGLPNLTPGTAGFGQITSTANNQRIVQIGGRLVF